MSLLKLKPALKDYIWGGTRLAGEYGKAPAGTRIAETWELSAHPDGESVVDSGPDRGLSLSQYIARAGQAVLGENAARFDRFPIIIKLIDAEDNLSVQVHPDDAYALEREGQYGKTEMWYVADCLPGACLYFGFKRPISREELARRIEAGTLAEVLNKVSVQKGDVFFIPPGTIHAIGKGIVIAEIQQSSNVTYRVFDYGRVDSDGNPRALHMEKALDVIDYLPATETRYEGDHLMASDYFLVDRFSLAGKVYLDADGASFHSVLVLDGRGTIAAGEERLDVKKGDSVFVTAGTGTYSVAGQCDLLRTTIPPAGDTC